MVRVRWGTTTILLAREDYQRISDVLDLDPFKEGVAVTASDSEVELRHGGGLGRAWTRFPHGSGATGGFLVEGQTVLLHPKTNPIGSALALRSAFAVAAENQQGLLVHASCFSFGGDAVMVAGASGAGKSSIARWAVRAGATLLSDEVVGLFPDGTVMGTPFFSDSDLRGTPTRASLQYVLTLRHWDRDAFDALPTHELVSAVCEQVFGGGGGANAAQTLRTVAAGLSGAKTGRWSCRNHPEAGLSLRALAEGGWTPE